MEQISNLSRLHGLLNGRMSMLGIKDKSYSRLSAMTDELISSSEIEGIFLNPNSVRSSIARRLGLEEDGLLAEDHYVEGLVDVMLDAITNCSETLTDERLFGWHAALFPLGRSGMYKITVAEWRKGDEPMQVVSGALGKEKVHYEAPPSSKVVEEMDKFLDWCNNVALSPFLKSAIAHLWFVSVHPFDDGNGRLSRTISDMFLANLDVDSGRYYSMSAEINRNKKSYYDMLEKTQKGNLDITDWLIWFFDILEKALKRALETIDHTLKKAAYWDKYNKVEVNERQRKIVNRLWDGFEGKLTSSKYAKICKCSQDTAIRDLNNLISKGMLIKGEAGGRSVNYHLPEYL